MWFENAKIVLLALLVFLAVTLNCWDWVNLKTTVNYSNLTNPEADQKTAPTETVAPSNSNYRARKMFAMAEINMAANVSSIPI